MKDPFEQSAKPKPEQAIARLAELVKQSDVAEVLPLDESYASVERLELYMRAVAQGKSAPGLTVDEFRWLVAAYLGQVCIRNLGGRWQLKEEQAAITKIPGLPASYVLFPIRSVVFYARSPRLGALREALQRHDLAYMQAKLERFHLELPTSLKRFAERAGIQPGKLALSLQSVAEAETLLTRTAASGAHDVEEVAELCARFIGEVVRVESEGQWEFTRDPRAVNFGFLCVGHRRGMPPESFFNPYFIVSSFRGSRKPGELASVCEKAARPRDGN